MIYNISLAQQAVQFLVESPYFHHHLKKLRGSVTKPRSLPFKDDAAALNELLVIGRQNLEAMENLIALAAHKRSGKNEYQKEYMAAKRKRDRKVIELEGLLLGAPLSKEKAAALLVKQYVLWHKEKERALIEYMPESWAEKNDATRAFWATKDQELDALLVEAQSQPTVKRRYRVAVPQQVTTDFGKALEKATRTKR